MLREAQEVAVINSALAWEQQRRAAPELAEEALAAVSADH